VISLVPAGKSEAARSVMLDRASILAANVLSDAVTFGYTRPNSFTSTPAGTPSVVFDSGTIPVPWPASATLKTFGVFGTSATTVVVPRQVTDLVCQGRDDLIYDLPASPDDPPMNKFIEGVRAFQGRTSSLIALASVSGTTLAAGDLAKLTVVVFHNRDMTAPFVTGTYDTSRGALSLPVPDGRRLREIVRPGTVIYDPSAIPQNAWCQVAMAAADEGTNPTNPSVYVTFSGIAPVATGRVHVLVDSVGMAERVVTLEGPGPFSQ